MDYNIRNLTTNCHLFPVLKQNLGIHNHKDDGNNNDMMADYIEYDFYEQGKETLSLRYDKCLGS